MTIAFNRVPLKALAAFSVDSTLCQKWGPLIFGYQGEETEEYKETREELKSCITDAIQELEEMKFHLGGVDG